MCRAEFPGAEVVLEETGSCLGFHSESVGALSALVQNACSLAFISDKAVFLVTIPAK